MLSLVGFGYCVRDTIVILSFLFLVYKFVMMLYIVLWGISFIRRT